MFGQYTNELAFLFWSIASLGYGFVVGMLAGMFARPYRSAVAGGILLGLPVLIYMALEPVDDGLFSWYCAILVGALGGLVGGQVGRRRLDRQLEFLGPALAVQQKDEELAAAKRKRVAEIEAAEAESVKAEQDLDRCLGCGHVMETHVTCPECGWSYL